MIGGLEFVVVAVLRIVQAAERRRRTSLSPVRRLPVPCMLLVLGVVGLLAAASGSAVGDATSSLIVVAVVAVAGGVARGSLTSPAVDGRGVHVARDRVSGLLIEGVATVVAFGLTLHALLSPAGALAAVSAWTVSVAVLDLAAYATTWVRARAVRPEPSRTA